MRGIVSLRTRALRLRKHVSRTLAILHSLQKGNANTLTHELIFDTLGNSRRRFVLRSLGEAYPHGLALRDVIESLATCEGSEDAEQSQTAVYVSLHQIHLPHLERGQLVTREEENDELSLTPLGLHVIPYLQTHPSVFSKYVPLVFAGISFVGAVFMVGGFFSFPVLPEIASSTIVTGLAISYLAIAICYLGIAVSQYTVRGTHVYE